MFSLNYASAVTNIQFRPCCLSCDIYPLFALIYRDYADKIDNPQNEGYDKSLWHKPLSGRAITKSRIFDAPHNRITQIKISLVHFG